MRRAERLRRAERIFTEASNLEDDGKLSQAFKKYRLAAQMGDGGAQLNLGAHLDTQPSRRKEAVYWYKRAVRSGRASAAWNLALLYQITGQARWSQYWLKVSAQMGDVDAKKELRKQRPLKRFVIPLPTAR